MNGRMPEKTRQGCAPWIAASCGLLVLACVPPFVDGVGGESAWGASVAAAEAGPDGGRAAGMACRTPCGDGCCAESEICTAGRCASPDACERGLGPTPVRIEDVPFSAVARIVRSAAPGTRVVLAPGTYTEPLRLKGSGRPGAPVVLAAEPPGSVRFSGAGQLEIIGDHFTLSGFDFDGGAIPVGTVAVLFRNCRHCRLTNCKIRRYRPVQGSWVHWVRFTTGHHNRIDHCEIHDKSDFREMLRVTNFTQGFDRIDHNHIHDFVRTPPKNGGEAIRLGTGGAARLQSRVENNLFERVRAEQEIISVKSSGNVLRGNTFRDCLGELTIRQGEDNLVQDNVFVATAAYPGGGVRAYGSGNRIEDNHFEGLVTGIRLGAGSADGRCYAPANGAIVRGNRFSGIAGQEITTDFMLGWKPFENCPPTDLAATGQVLEDNEGPADTRRAYRAPDPCIGPDW